MLAPDGGLRHLFRSSRYLEMAERLAPAYAAASPFPHVVIDDFLPEPLVARVLAEFPSPEAPAWDRLDKSAYSKKLAANREEQVGPFIFSVLEELNGADFLRFLEALTGIQGLTPDPYFEGGGLHQILPGGFLKVHADFNFHSSLRLDRRLNLLLYLNRDWRDEYAGHLELWDRTMTRREVRVMPAFNRAVLFSTTDWSYHGHPDPLACPAGMTRKSMALYYYSRGRPEEEESPAHSTLWQVRPAEADGSRLTWARRLRRLARLLDRLPNALRHKADSLDGLPPGLGD
jgi:hypothetical protein